MLVWLQAPSDGWGDDWANLGVNGFYGLWRWPEDGDKYPGWAVDTLQELQKNDQYAYAGESPDAVRRTLQMTGNERIVGWLGGDEPDMFGPNPQEWTTNINAMLAIQDRPVAANFGLGFGGFDWWYDHISDADRAAWCAPVDVPSVDYYGMTSPNNPANQNGAWTYGRAIDNLRKACGDNKPLGIFVETTEITTGAKTATPAGIKAAAWNGVIHGADHVDLFVHDFDCTNGECGAMAFMTAAKYAPQRQAVKELSDELNKWNAVLRTPDVKGADAATVTGIPLHTLTKRSGGKTYVFAQSAGDSTRIDGYSGTATVTVAGKSFTDQWTPNQVRIYIAE